MSGARVRHTVLVVLGIGWLVGVLGCDQPSGLTNPDPLGRTGYIGMRINCGLSGPASIQCSAFAFCTGLYPFCPGFRDGDVTAIAPWSTMHPNIADVVAPGRFDAVLRVSAPGFVTQERAVVGPSSGGSVNTDFALVRER